MKEKFKAAYERLFVDEQAKARKDAVSRIHELEACDAGTIVAARFPVALAPTVELSATLHRDVEFWHSVFPKIDKTRLEGGRALLRSLLSAPVKERETLALRRSLVEGIESRLEASDARALSALSELESSAIWAFREVEENMADLYDMAYFKMMFVRRLNASPEALTAHNQYRILMSPLVGLLSPVVYFLVPYLVVVKKFGLKISFWSYLKLTWQTMMNSNDLIFGAAGRYRAVQAISYLFSAVFYFQGVFNSFDIARTLHKITRHLTEKMNSIAKFAKAGAELISKHWTDDVARAFEIEGSALLPISQEMRYAESLPSKPYSVFSNFGRQLAAYRSLDLSAIRSIMYKVYAIDALASVAAFRAEYGYGYAEFLEDGEPAMKLRGLRHPAIDREACVANSLALGDSAPRNAIITGTNAGGKSVTLKAILINALLSQACGVSCCDASAMTPLWHLSSQINVPDSTGHESLFEAEMFRCKGNLDALATREGPSMIVMDEIFSSTNPLEAICGAYAVCKKMSECENNILVFTTHFNYLTKLGKTGRFANYKMETIVDGDSVEFTYKLVPGVNKHFLALELLKKNGFDPEIIEDALELKKKFVKLS